MFSLTCTKWRLLQWVKEYHSKKNVNKLHGILEIWFGVGKSFFFKGKRDKILETKWMKIDKVILIIKIVIIELISKGKKFKKVRKILM